MPDLCKECKHFFIDYKRLPGIGDNLPKTGNEPSDYIPQDKCKLGHEIRKSAVGLVPFSRDYTCNDFIKK